jgi:hypothetical protein
MTLASPAHMSYRYVDKFFGLQTQIHYITVIYNIYCLQKFSENKIYATTTIVATAVLSMSDIYAKFAK